MKSSDQISFYNAFGQAYRESIINAEHPESWTADPDPSSPANIAMKERTAMQERVVKKYFSTEIPVLDLGCGFGRQTYLMAKNNFRVTGVDNSQVFIDIARDLLNKRGVHAALICDSVLNFQPEGKFNQVTLFDVIEHFTKQERKHFFYHLANTICTDEAIVVLTFPFMNPASINDRLINAYKYFTSPIAFLSKRKEHPYPIPFHRSFSNTVRPWFDILEFFSQGDTAFYILRKKSGKR